MLLPLETTPMAKDINGGETQMAASQEPPPS